MMKYPSGLWLEVRRLAQRGDLTSPSEGTDEPET